MDGSPTLGKLHSKHIREKDKERKVEMLGNVKTAIRVPKRRPNWSYTFPFPTVFPPPSPIYRERRARRRRPTQRALSIDMGPIPERGDSSQYQQQNIGTGDRTDTANSRTNLAGKCQEQIAQLKAIRTRRNTWVGNKQKKIKNSGTSPKREGSSGTNEVKPALEEHEKGGKGIQGLMA